MRQALTQARMEGLCRDFNDAKGIGEQILVYAGAVGGEVEEVVVAEPGAYVLGGHTPVVQVMGGRRAHGCIALTHVLRVRP